MELIILPSTKSAIAYVRRLAAEGPLRVIGDPKLIPTLDPSFGALALSPLAAWREVRGLDALPYRLVSFPDQVFGIGPSFRKLKLADDTYSVSTIEAMIAWKFQPAVSTLPSMDINGKIDRLTGVDCAFAATPLTSDAQLDEAIARLVSPVLTFCRAFTGEWPSRRNFNFKINHAMHRTLGQKFGEIEGLIRLTDWSGKPEAKTSLLNEIKSAKRKLLTEISR